MPRVDMSSLNRGGERNICLFESLNMSLKMFVFISNGVL